VNKLDSIYTIQDLVDGNLITTHIKNLRQFHYDPDRTNPKDIAVQNIGEFFIDSTLEHRGDRQRRSTMEFKVRWLPEYDSWEPYKKIAHTEQLILYLVRHQMRSLVPKGHWSCFVPIGKDPTLPRLAKNKYLQMHDVFPYSQFFTLLGVGLE